MEKTNLSQYQDFQENKFTKRLVHKEDSNVIFVLNFTPGTELPTHKHPGANVYLLVLEGAGSVTHNERQTDVAKGDIIHINGDESFSFRCGTEAASSLYVVLTQTPNENYAKNV